MKDTTIIYYTHNKEDPVLERKIMDNILKVKGDLPIISVSQKPIDFGTNICVGEQPMCDSNGIKQLLIGLKAAKTKYAIAAESDTLYPPEYFDFIPPRDDVCYRYTNLYIQWRCRRINPRFYTKSFVEGAQSCNREYWIHRIEKVLGGRTDWEPQEIYEPVFPTRSKFAWTSPNPVLILKTGNGVRIKSPIHRGFPPLDTIPYWGHYADVISKW